MSIESIGVAGWRVAQKLERMAAKNGQNTLTTIRNGRFVLRTDLNNDKYSRTVVETNREGIATSVYSDLMLRNSKKLRAKLASFLNK